MNCEFVDKLFSKAEKLGIMLSFDQLDKFYRYYELLIEWNKIMNLTAITQEDDVISKHFIDSLMLTKVLNDLKNESLSFIDVGTGAGFPGLPLKIGYPNLNMTLLDSLRKRTRFLDHVIKELYLENTVIIHGRAEDYGKNLNYREKYDVCVSRAVANITTLSEYCLPFVKTGGCFVSYKSGNIEEELNAGKNAVKILGAEISSVLRFVLDEKNGERTLILIRKTKSTPKRFPRKAGIPLKEPLV